MNTTRVLIVGLLAAAGLLTACSGQEQAASDDTSATTTAAPPSTSASEGQPAPESPQPSSGAPDGGEATGIAPGEPDPNGGVVDCGGVKTGNGKADLVAEDTPAGTVGCTEAINVITEYIAQAATKGEGTAHSLTVDGWSCLTDTGAQGTGTIGCDKDGLAFHTVP
jgi:hypothetical protein